LGGCFQTERRRVKGTEAQRHLGIEIEKIEIGLKADR